jgi:hypothetical protein
MPGGVKQHNWALRVQGLNSSTMLTSLIAPIGAERNAAGKAYSRRRLFFWVHPLWIVLILIGQLARGEEFESVSSKTSREYVRRKETDGSFARESYAFANGGYWSGPMFDPTIDKMDFIEIARTIAVPLANQNYIPTADPKTTKLLLVVYWGTTFAPEHASDSSAYAMGQKKAEVERESNQNLQDALRASGQSQGASPTDSWAREARVTNAQDGDALSASLGVMQAENRTRDQANLRNAAMLGYDAEWNELMGSLGGPAQDLKKSAMIAELEEDRYFVVVMAYDYQLLVSSKKHKLLWETRYSIRQHTHAFNLQLMSMTVQASKYFGQDSNGLTRKSLPEGKVEIGGVRNLGDVPENQLKHPAASGGK